jgi:tetratricopeptide (TPR) repeat protein
MTTPPSTRQKPAPDPDSRAARFRQLASSGLLVLGVFACVFATAIGVSAMGGYVAGQKQRNVSATQTTAMSIDLQYSLGLTDLQAGNYELAADRFRWVLEHSPGYPGAAESLAEAEAAVNTVDIPEVATLIPSTSDNPDQLFAEAKEFVGDEDWANAISRLEQVQSIDSSYQNIEVKEMLYTAYSTLGLQYVQGDRIEEGLYLLEQAEKIRPLSDFTAGERNLALLYTTGQIYWGLDWNVVIQNFIVIYEIAPNYRDVQPRLREAYVKWGDQLWRLGAPCDAVLQYDNALNMEVDNEVQDKRTSAQDACDNPTLMPTATSIDALTPEGTDAVPDGTQTPNFIP